MPRPQPLLHAAPGQVQDDEDGVGTQDLPAELTVFPGVFLVNLYGLVLTATGQTVLKLKPGQKS